MPVRRILTWWSAAKPGRRVAAVMLALLLGLATCGMRWDPGRPSSVVELASGSDADRTDPVQRLLPPLARSSHGEVLLLGTDQLGRSLALRLNLALGTCLLIAGLGALVAVAIGTAVGTLAGLAGGMTDRVMMRFSEVSAGIPAVLIILVLVSALREWGRWILFATMGLLFWQGIARVVRARAMRLANEPYVEAARALGAPTWHTVRRHVLPGLWPTVVSYGTLLIPRLILLESLLSYLGVAGTSTHSFGRIISGLSATLSPLSPSWMPVLVACSALVAVVLTLTTALESDQ